MMKSSKPLGRVTAALVVVSAAIVAALAGGASTGHAATSFTVDLQPLIGTTGNEIPQVSEGGKIGYHLVVTNAGTSTAQHATIVVTSNLATFSDADNARCVQNPTDAHQLVCTPLGGTMAPGATFDVRFRYTAPLTEGTVSTSAALTIAAQTVGGSNNNGTLAKSASIDTNVVENTTKSDSFLHANENAGTGNLSAGHPQNFSVQLPNTLFGSPFGVALSIHDEVGTPICGTCLTSFTTLKIPVASLVTTPGNPFYDGINVNRPYSWSMNARYPSGFKFTGIYHLEDGALPPPDLVPSCASIGGGPTAGDPLCWDTLVQNKPTKTLQAAGRGLENGNIGFG